MKTITIILAFSAITIQLAAQSLEGKWYRSSEVVLTFAENGFITENNNGTITLGSFVYNETEQTITITWAGKPSYTYTINNLTDTTLSITAADGTYYEYYASLNIASTNQKTSLDNASPSLPKSHEELHHVIRCTTCNGLGRVYWYDEVDPQTQQTKRVYNTCPLCLGRRTILRSEANIGRN